MEKETKTRLKINKSELLEKLGLEGTQVSFIQYNWKTQQLELDLIGEVNKKEDDEGWFKF